MSPRTALNKDLIMRRVTERYPSQVQATATTSPTTMTESDVTFRFPHERWDIFHIGVPFGSYPTFSSSSDGQTSTPSDLSTFLQSGLNQFRVMTQTPLSRPGAVSAIDKEIDAARRLVHSLLSRRNAMAPISTLPPELLARIFRFLILGDLASFGFPTMGWFEATHVCRHWRQVALDDSSLWARVTGFSPSPEWISETLVRARNAPLDINLVGVPNPELLSKFLPHISHTRQLRFRDLCMHHSQRVKDICALEAPALEHFELGISAGSPIAFRQLAGSTLFKGRTPKLRRLILAQITIPWSLIPRGQLTELKINLFRGTPTPNNSGLDDSNQLIDFLINSPELKVLVLEFCLPSLLSQVSQEQSIHLPRLSHLCLGGSTRRVTSLLRRLKLPSSAALHLRCISESPSTHDDYHILPLISAHFHNSTPVEFKSFRVTVNCLERHIDVAASITPPKSTTYHSRIFEGDMDSEAELFLSFDGLSAFGTSTQGDILRRLCSMLTISNLEFLSISAPDVGQSVDWFELFQHCKKVTTIQARGRGTNGLMPSLAPPKSTNANPPRVKGKKGRRDNGQTRTQATNSVAGAHAPATPFPKLTSLMLENLDFGAHLLRGGVLYDVLANTLRRRKENHMQLKTLSVDRCVISIKRANCLKRHVGELRWDGDEGVSYYDGWDDYDYSSDLIETGARLEDFFYGGSQNEWEWFENYSDGW